jgi:hypothetical protein
MTQTESKRPTMRSSIGPGSVMKTVRFLAVVYVVQAGVGIALGFAYTVWLYW